MTARRQSRAERGAGRTWWPQRRRSKVWAWAIREALVVGWMGGLEVGFDSETEELLGFDAVVAEAVAESEVVGRR